MTQNKKRIVCDRCGSNNEPFYPIEQKDEETGEVIKLNICWDCDFDIINGRGELSDDPMDIWYERKEEAYAYDPINNPSPYSTRIEEGKA